jgi:hypothetical protein
MGFGVSMMLLRGTSLKQGDVIVWESGARAAEEERGRVRRGRDT